MRGEGGDGSAGSPHRGWLGTESEEEEESEEEDESEGNAGESGSLTIGSMREEEEGEDVEAKGFEEATSGLFVSVFAVFKGFVIVNLAEMCFVMGNQFNC